MHKRPISLTFGDMVGCIISSSGIAFLTTPTTDDHDANDDGDHSLLEASEIGELQADTLGIEGQHTVRCWRGI